jgi:hypothetical protein
MSSIRLATLVIHRPKHSRGSSGYSDNKGESCGWDHNINTLIASAELGAFIMLRKRSITPHLRSNEKELDGAPQAVDFRR